MYTFFKSILMVIFFGRPAVFFENKLCLYEKMASTAKIIFRKLYWCRWSAIISLFIKNGIRCHKAYIYKYICIRKVTRISSRMGHPWVIINEHRAVVCAYICGLFLLNKQTNNNEITLWVRSPMNNKAETTQFSLP